MRKISLVCVLACVGSWLVACGDDSGGGDSDAGVSGNGGTTGGTGGTATGGNGGTATGGGGTGGSTGGTANGGGGTGGGNGGTANGGGGTGGTATGGGGTGGVAPPTNYCDGDYSALPFNVAENFTAVNIIGQEAVDYVMTVIDTPDCEGSIAAVAAAVVDGGADASVSDASTGTTDASTGTTDASTSSDASVSDASTGTPDAAVDAGPPLPACYAFDYNPTCAEGTACWAGAIFQTNDAGVGGVQQGNLDGQAGEGICIALGATHVSFEARASEDVSIKFGSTRPGVGTTELWVPITTEWDTYTVTTSAYNRNASDTVKGVWNLFSIVAALGEDPGAPTGQVQIQVRNIVWEQ